VLEKVGETSLVLFLVDGTDLLREEIIGGASRLVVMLYIVSEAVGQSACTHVRLYVCG